MKIAGIVLLCLAVAGVAVPVLFDFFVICVYRWGYGVTKRLEGKKGVLGDYDRLPKTPFTVKGDGGYVLHCEYIPAAEESHRFVILSHGYTYTKYGSVKYMHLFRQLGYNCILYDNRGHGKNAFAACTFGIRESRDLLCLIRAVRQKCPPNAILGLHGESMGSGIGITALGAHPPVDFVVNDCGYGVLSAVLEHKLKQIFHLPSGFLRYLDRFAKPLFGYSFYDVRPIDSLKTNRVPICFIHGRADTFIPFAQSRAMQAATAGYSELHLFDGADHAQCIEKDPAQYRQVVTAFLDKVTDPVLAKI